MLISDLAELISEEDISEVRELWKRKYYREEQDRILDIFESYTGEELPRDCGKCRSEWLDKMRKVLKILDND